MATRTTFDNSNTSSPNPAGLFANFSNVSSLQTLIVERLLESHSEVKLSDTVKESIKTICRPKLIQELLQAVIDDDLKSVKKILNFDPELLLIEPASLGVTEIESKKTWRKFITERPFIMAQKLQSLPMTKILFTYLEQLDSENNTQELVNQWILPAFVSRAEQKELNDKKLQLQQDYIKKYFAPLIEVIAADHKVKVLWVLNEAKNIYEIRIANMKKKTTAALEAFREKLLSDNPIAIDDGIDVQQLQIAAFKTHKSFFENSTATTLKNWDHRDIFLVFAIGFLQGLSAPQLGAAYCEGLNNVAYFNQPIGERAGSHKFGGGESFYRTSRNSVSGIGFNFVCSIYGVREDNGAMDGRFNRSKQAYLGIENLIETDAKKFSELAQRVDRLAAEHAKQLKRSWCAVL